MRSPSVVRYDPIAVFLHWTIAICILVMIPLGFFMDRLPPRFDAYTVHKSIGLCVLALSLFRLIWRLLNPPPSLPETITPFERYGAKIVHWMFYFLIIAMPLTGWLMVSASQKYPTIFFWSFEVPFLPMPEGIDGKSTAKQLNAYHAQLAWCALVLLALHIGGALKHHFIHRDTVLRRMLPLFPHATPADQ